MIRKLILPALAVLLLSGCMTGYTYRTAPGDYYYGQPATIYRGHYYGGYGYPGYYGYYGYPYYGSYRYRYGYPYYRNPWPGRPHSPRPGNDNGGGKDTPDRKPPWRDLGSVADPSSRPSSRLGTIDRRPGQRETRIRRAPAPAPRPAPQARPEHRGSAMSEMIRRAQPKRDVRRSMER